MKASWGRFFRRVATVCMVGASTAWSSAVSYAALIAADSSTNAPYDNGWQAGDNGGFGWGAWDFTGTLGSAVQQTIDIFSDPNDLGRAWTMYNPDAPPGPGAGTDLAQSGRAILGGGLSVGQTVTVVIDNPTERNFFRGYTVNFNTGGGNTVYAGVPQSRLRVGTFEYFTNGRWYATGTPAANVPLFDVDTDHGMRIDVTLTGVDTFHLEMTPLNDPSIKYTKNGTLAGPAGAAIDWVEFEMYNTDSDWYPSHTLTGGDTDFYISYMQIAQVPEPSTALLGLLGGGALAGIKRRRRS